MSGSNYERSRRIKMFGTDYMGTNSGSNCKMVNGSISPNNKCTSRERLDERSGSFSKEANNCKSSRNQRRNENSLIAYGMEGSNRRLNVASDTNYETGIKIIEVIDTMGRTVMVLLPVPGRFGSIFLVLWFFVVLNTCSKWPCDGNLANANQNCKAMQTESNITQLNYCSSCQAFLGHISAKYS